MMTGKKRKSLIALIMSLVWILSACSGRTQEAEPNLLAEAELSSDEGEWILEDIPLPSPEEALRSAQKMASESDVAEEDHRELLYTCLAGETVYRYVRQYDAEETVIGYYLQVLSAPYSAWETTMIPAAGEERISRRTGRLLAFSEDTGLNILAYEPEGACFLEQISPQGEYSVRRLTADGIGGVLGSADKWYRRGDQCYLHTTDGLFCFDPDFAEGSKLSEPDTMNISRMAEDASGEQLYLWGISADGVMSCLWCADSYKPVISIGDVIYWGQQELVFCSDTQGYLCDQEEIRQFELASGTVKELERYQDFGYHLGGIRGASCGGDGTLLILADQDSARSGDSLCLLKRVRQEKKEKKTLVLATVIADRFLSESVAIFNKQNEEYEIVLRERPDLEYRQGTPTITSQAGDTAYQVYLDYRTRVQTEIATGGGPDLIDTQLLSVEDGAANHCLRDLTEDFADQREACMENVWQNGVVDGRLYSVPYLFTLDTFVAKESTVGDREGWTLEELMQITRESGVDTFCEYRSPYLLFWHLGIRTEGNPQLIDWEKRVCRLNGPEAMELLLFTREYGDTRNLTEDIKANYEYASQESRVLVGEALTAETFFAEIDRTLKADQVGFAFCGTNPVYIGYPTASGESEHVMNVTDLEINQACACPEGAVAFLAFLQSEERQNAAAEHLNDLGCGFPVRKSSIERVLERAEEGDYELQAPGTTRSWYILGESVKDEPFSRETLEKFRRVLETAKPASRRASELMDMISEELEPYYAGDKSAEEVLDIIQNRAQLYLDEMR